MELLKKAVTVKAKAIYDVVWPVSGTTWLQASALDWSTTLLSPRKSFCSTDMTKMLPAQRSMSGREEEEPRKYV